MPTWKPTLFFVLPFSNGIKWINLTMTREQQLQNNIYLWSSCTEQQLTKLKESCKNN